jgi:hypothetical protein
MNIKNLWMLLIFLASSKNITAQVTNTEKDSVFMGQRNFLGRVVFQANNFSNLNKKKLTSLTPLWLALKSFSCALNDSADALVDRLLKKFMMPS